jgi:poly-gamma-glutamate capsule biosynthesis protein CapA/YwtB (metallophosphatase superfamily)
MAETSRVDRRMPPHRAIPNSMIRSPVLLAVAGLVLLGAGAWVAARADALVVAAGGDLIGPYKRLAMTHDAALDGVAALFQQADVGFANQEGSIFDLDAFSGYPAAENGGGYPLAPEGVALDLKRFGISLVSKANNHATDYGVQGLLTTLQSLKQASIAQAGAGLSDGAARAPVYLDTPHGRVALVSTASTFPPMAVAGPVVTRRDTTTRPRPGISVIHVHAVHLIAPDQLTALEHIAGTAAVHTGREDELRIGDEFFRVGAPAMVTWQADEEDRAAVIAAVREARAHAQVVIFAIHAHETAGTDDPFPPAINEPMILHRANEAASPEEPTPADFEVALFHAVIDAGADMVIRTGPHVLNGIELYQGKPVFYGLGSLFFDFGGQHTYTTLNGQVMQFTDMWYQTIVPVVRFENGRASEIRLYPISIQSSESASDGDPHRADHEAARRILDRLQTNSKVFGTRIEQKGDIGYVR